MVTKEEIMQRLAGLNMSEISRRSGLAYQTVFRLAKGQANNPQMDTLSRAFKVADELRSAKK